MEPDDPPGLSSYFHHHHQTHQTHQQEPHYNRQPPPFPHHTTTTTVSSPPPTNGILQNSDRAGTHMVYPHSVPSAAVSSSPSETVRRKRGRPRKYGTPEQAAAAKRLAAGSSSSSTLMPLSPHRSKKDQNLGASSTSSSSKKPQLAGLGNSCQSFTPHIITVAVGEDVANKIMLFMQRSKHEICILSASGSISNASLLQPSTSGGSITYEVTSHILLRVVSINEDPPGLLRDEGRFDILSMSGSYVRTELGDRAGGLSVCLSSNDGQIIGGGVGGPLTAAGPVQVIVGTFDTKNNITTVAKVDASARHLASSIVGAPVSSLGFQAAADSSGRIGISGSDDQHNIDGKQFMTQPRGMSMTSPQLTDWMGSNDSRSNAPYDFSGRIGHGGNQTPENGDYDQYRD